MNAIDLLLEQHRQVEALFDRIEKGDEDEKAVALEECAEALTIHTAIEEQIFYPGVKSAQTEDILKESVVEHLEAKRTLADIMAADPASANIDALAKKLIKEVKHHVEEEESELFPKVRQQLSAKKLEEMGQLMEALADRLGEEEDVSVRVEEETNRPAPL